MKASFSQAKEVFSSSHITMYDVQDSMEQIENNLQTALNSLQIWCRQNGMILNSSKTKVVLVT